MIRRLFNSSFHWLNTLHSIQFILTTTRVIRCPQCNKTKMRIRCANKGQNTQFTLKLLELGHEGVHIHSLRVRTDNNTYLVENVGDGNRLALAGGNEEQHGRQQELRMRANRRNVPQRRRDSERAAGGERGGTEAGSDPVRRGSRDGRRAREIHRL